MMAHGNLTRDSANWSGRTHRSMGDAFGQRAASQYDRDHARRRTISRMVRRALGAVALVGLGAILGGCVTYAVILLRLALSQ